MLGSALLQTELSDEQHGQALAARDRLERGPRAEGGERRDEEPCAYLLTGMSLLFTWNIGSPEDPDAEWRHFLAWRRAQAVGRLASVRFSATMEESLNSEDDGRVRIHEQREMCKRLTRASLEPFRYATSSGEVICPNVAPNCLEAVSSADGSSGRSRGAAFRAACDRAHFYVQANKFGTLFTETDYPLQKNFRVQAKWFDDLVARGNLSRDQWLQHAYDSTIGFSSRKRNFEALEAHEKQMATKVDSACLQ